jgi:hypothetical protein
MLASPQWDKGQRRSGELLFWTKPSYHFLRLQSNSSDLVNRVPWRIGYAPLCFRQSLHGRAQTKFGRVQIMLSSAMPEYTTLRSLPISRLGFSNLGASYRGMLARLSGLTVGF